MSEIVLSKNEYVGGGLVYVKRSLILKGDKNNILSVQMHNGADFIVNGVILILEYLDREGGSVYDCQEITVDGLRGLPETDFILPDIAAPLNRKAVNVKLRAVLSDGCIYKIDGDGGEMAGELCGNNSGKDGASVKRVKGRYTKIFVFALIALIALSFAVALPAFAGVYNAGTSAEIIGEEYAQTR